ncbi:MAG TPA: DUF1552 domain-containing protein, partial [Steroidobacteraceae bacterium]
MLTKKHLSRRALLRGAGATLALPLLDAMIPAGVVRAATAATPAARLACIYVPHGAVMNRWTPAQTGTGFEFSPTLKPLEPFRDRINVITGLSLPLASGQDASAGANHSRSSAVYLTGAEAREGSEAHLGVSIDQLAARRIGQNSLLPSLEMCIEDGAQDCGVGLSCAYRNTISWQTATSPLPMENNPQVVFERLFGDGATEQQRAARRDQARSLLDSVLDEVGSLQRTLPAKDRERMDRYLTDIREVERRIALAATQGAASVKLPNAPAGIPEDFDAHIKLLFDLQVLAWQANVTRVTTIMFAKETSNAVYAASGVREPFHNLSHHSNVPESLDRLAQLNTYHVKTFAYLLQKLKSTPDGEGNLLD